MTVRSEPRASDGRLPASSNDGLRTESSIPNRYVLIADALIAAFAHDPLALGVYVAIARLTLAAKDAVPLAARDLVAWIGSDRDADRAAIMRRIVKLERDGWLIIVRASATKHRLLPNMGTRSEWERTALALRCRR